MIMIAGTSMERYQQVLQHPQVSRWIAEGRSVAVWDPYSDPGGLFKAPHPLQSRELIIPTNARWEARKVERYRITFSDWCNPQGAAHPSAWMSFRNENYQGVLQVKGGGPTPQEPTIRQIRGHSWVWETWKSIEVETAHPPRPYIDHIEEAIGVYLGGHPPRAQASALCKKQWARYAKVHFDLDEGGWWANGGEGENMDIEGLYQSPREARCNPESR